MMYSPTLHGIMDHGRMDGCALPIPYLVATIKLIKVPIKCSLFFGKYCNKQKIDLSDVSTKNICEPRTQDDDGVK